MMHHVEVGALPPRRTSLSSKCGLSYRYPKCWQFSAGKRKKRFQCLSTRLSRTARRGGRLSTLPTGPPMKWSSRSATKIANFKFSGVTKAVHAQYPINTGCRRRLRLLLSIRSQTRAMRSAASSSFLVASKCSRREIPTLTSG